MRGRFAGILIVLAALVAAPSALAQEPTETPTPTPTPEATPTPTPTPTPEEIEEAERKEKLRKRKVVRRVYSDFQRDGRIDNCDHSRTALKRTLQSITDEFDADFPDFREAIKAAIKDHDKERCEEEEEPEATPTPSATPPPTTTPAPTTPTTPPSTDSGDLPDLGGGAGGGGGGNDGGGGAAPPPVDNNATPPPTEGDITPVQPEATPAPTAVPPTEPQLAVVSPEGDPNLTIPAILLAAALAGLALLAASALAARRGGRLAGWGHALREAGYRATGAWGDFGDWLRLGR
jgi:hypothetical protein